MPVCLIDLCLSVRSRLSVRAISGPGVVFFGADADAREEEGVQQRAAGGAASGRREERGDGPDLRRGSDLAIKAAYCNLYYSLDRHGEEPFRGIDPLARAHLGTSRHISAHLGASPRLSAHLGTSQPRGGCLRFRAAAATRRRSVEGPSSQTRQAAAGRRGRQAAAAAPPLVLHLLHSHHHLDHRRHRRRPRCYPPKTRAPPAASPRVRSRRWW